VSDWIDFAQSVASLMRRAKRNEIELDAISDFIEKSTAITNEELRRYAEAMVWEIGGSPDYYDDLMTAFETSTAEADLITYINSK
jgi:hypothetical protein